MSINYLSSRQSTIMNNLHIINRATVDYMGIFVRERERERETHLASYARVDNKNQLIIQVRENYFSLICVIFLYTSLVENWAPIHFSQGIFVL